MKISAQAKRAWRNRLIFVALVAAGIAVYIIYINSFTIFDYSELLADTVQDFGESQTFTPLASAAPLVDGMVRVAETDYLALYLRESDSKIAVVDLRYGHNHVWYSSPPGAGADPIANLRWQNTMRSHVEFNFFTEARLRNFRLLYADAMQNGQFEVFSIPGGVRINYTIGNMDPGIDRIPFFIETNFFNERVMGQVTGVVEQLRLQNNWRISEEIPGFMQMTASIRDFRIHTDDMLALFDSIGWTMEETYEQNALAGVVVEGVGDFFYMTLEFVIEDDRLIVNMPLSEFTTSTPNQPFNFDFMRFFGAGGTDQDGFILVPSGTGGKIMFNNEKQSEEPFMSAVYGMDSLMNIIRPQVTQPVRLPVFGIQNETKGAAFLAQVYRGSALATIGADVAGRTNSYNHAWFRFTLRASEALAMPGIGGGAADMMVVQDDIYEGDITIIYHFLTSPDTSNPPGVGAMAEVYRNFLVDTGVLTPLDGPGNRSFYMDIIGAIDIQRHFMGTPFITTEVMTTLEDAGRFVSILNDATDATVPVQMQLHGWFNRGINHDVAKNVRRINSVGSRQEMLDLNSHLQQSGGGLHPAVNFQFTNYYSRNFNRTFESAKDLAGYIGFMSRYTMRDSLTVRFSPHANDWYLLVHPGALPFHIDRFIPAFHQRTAMDGLALTDLGDILTESLFRRDGVDRETARIIIREQMRRLSDEIPSLVVFGGNDYSLEFASHLVDVPVHADLQYIIDYEVPFFPMVVHGFIEFAGRSANMREDYSPTVVLLNSIATGASPRYTLTAQPTRNAQFSPHERFYSTQYVNWIEAAAHHYNIFNEVHAPLRAETISDFEILAGSYLYVGGRQVTVTEFSNGTRIYVNNTTNDFDAGGFTIPAEWFVVR